MYSKGNKVDELDQTYSQILKYGLLVLRAAIASRDTDWALAEVELLHTIPTLLGRSEVKGHRYFWNGTREMYLEWLASSKNAEAQSRARTYYFPLFEALQPLIEARCGSE